MKTKGLFAALGCLVLLLTLLPNPALAVDQNYTMDFSQNALISWGPFTIHNFHDDDASDTGWSWDASEKKLTLGVGTPHFSFTTTEGIALKLPAGAKLVLAAGSASTLTSLYNETVVDSAGLNCLGALEISGGGTLNVRGGTPSGKNSYGLYADGDIKLSEGDLIATGGTTTGAAGNSYGVYSAGAITNGDPLITKEHNLTGIGGVATTDARSYGIFATGAVTLYGGSTTASGYGSALSGSGVANQVTLHYPNGYVWKQNTTPTEPTAYEAGAYTPAEIYRYLKWAPAFSPETSADVPRTGDSAPLALLYGLMLLCGAGLVAGLVMRRKRRNG